MGLRIVELKCSMEVNNLSVEKSRFKIKKGDIEIEFEGDSKEVNPRYEEAFEWVKTATVHTLAPPETKPAEEKKKEEKRGGARSSVVSRAIDTLIEEGWFDEFRKVSDVIEELKRRIVPGTYHEAVIGALNRRVPEKLDRVKDTDGKWTYGRKKKK